MHLLNGLTQGYIEGHGSWDGEFDKIITSLYIKRGKVSVQRWAWSQCHNDKDVMMRISGLVADGTGRRYGDWWHVNMGCNALVLCGAHERMLVDWSFMEFFCYAEMHYVQHAKTVTVTLLLHSLYVQNCTRCRTACTYRSVGTWRQLSVVTTTTRQLISWGCPCHGDPSWQGDDDVDWNTITHNTATLWSKTSGHWPR